MKKGIDKIRRRDYNTDINKQTHTNKTPNEMADAITKSTASVADSH